MKVQVATWSSSSLNFRKQLLSNQTLSAKLATEVNVCSQSPIRQNQQSIKTVDKKQQQWVTTIEAAMMMMTTMIIQMSNVSSKLRAQSTKGYAKNRTWARPTSRVRLMDSTGYPVSCSNWQGLNTSSLLEQPFLQARLERRSMESRSGASATRNV